VWVVRLFASMPIDPLPVMFGHLNIPKGVMADMSKMEAMLTPKDFLPYALQAEARKLQKLGMSIKVVVDEKMPEGTAMLTTSPFSREHTVLINPGEVEQKRGQLPSKKHHRLIEI
jgi:hypothetical protein